MLPPISTGSSTRTARTSANIWVMADGAPPAQEDDRMRDGQMKGKTCMVTGATSGIGLVTAQALAQQGATVIVVGRNPGKGVDTVASIRQETGNPEVEFMLADLSVQAPVRTLAREFTARHARLDVLVNNAGAFFFKRQLSADGIEMTFALNYVSVFLLTHLLLEALQASDSARIVNVSSDAHRSARMHFEDLKGQRRYTGFGAYSQAKLAVVLFTYELARRLQGAHVTVNALHPGFVATNLYATSGGVMKLLAPLFARIALSPEEGAQTSIYLAASPEVMGVSGAYFARKQAVRSSPASYDQAVAQRLWTISAELTGL
jgi:NAD(P)-dependent dehydrogenase (short-subunit alcohol dehydrogenase family)